MRYLKRVCIVFVVWLMAGSVCSAAIAPISSVVTDNPDGSPPYNVQSVTVGSYTVDRIQLANGTSTGSLQFNPDMTIPELDDLDLSFAWSNGETGNEFSVHMFGGVLWKDSNGDNPDFFLFEAGSGDGSEIAAILPGGVVGQSVPLSGSWGNTGHNSNGQSIDGNTTGNGQSIVGISWAITDLLDENGNALTNDSTIEGLAVTARNGMDPADWFAVLEPPYQAKKPRPEDKATDVIREIRLSWEPGWSASQHIVYFGTDLDAVSNGADSVKVGPAQDALSYEPPGLLDFGQTYFWRVDEVNGMDVWEGDVWRFEVEPYSIAVPIGAVQATASSAEGDNDAGNTVNGSGLDENDHHSTRQETMWQTSMADAAPAIQFEFDQLVKLDKVHIWNHNTQTESIIGFGIKEALIEASIDGETWQEVGLVELSQAPGTDTYAGEEIAIGGVVAKVVKISGLSNYSILGLPQMGLSEVRFFYLPTYAREPQPADGAGEVAPDVVLEWRSGREAAQHEVYVGESADSLILAGTSNQAAFDTQNIDLQLGQTYSWTVTEVNEAATPPAWEGDVWTFTVAEPLVVDDMESYQDEEGLQIWAAWLDGTEFGTDDPANGSIVGANPLQNNYLPATGLGRGQSLPIWFDNTIASYSEAMRVVENEDWSRHGINSLSLYFRKGEGNTGGGQVYVTINNKNVVYEDPADVPPGWQTDQWVHWVIDLSTVGADLTKVTKMMIGVQGANAKGVLYVDDIALHKNTPMSEQAVSWFEAESGTRGPTMMLFDDLGGSLGASGGKFIGTEDGSGEDTAAVQLDGIATYNFSVDQAGAYKVMMRGGDFGGNSFWVRIPGSDMNTSGNADNPGWVLCNTVSPSDALGWSPVTDDNDGDRVVEFTLAAGQHTLEFGRREDGAFLDAIAIVSVTE